MGYYVEVVDDLRQPMRELRKAMPDAWGAFGQLHQSAVAEGVLPARIKELIALAIAVATHCEGCMALHAKAAAQKGATEDEVVEALGVALLMAGGPASVDGPKALDAFREFSA